MAQYYQHMTKLLFSKKINKDKKIIADYYAYLEWLSELEVVFSSNLYTKYIVADYLTTNKIKTTEDPLVDNPV